MNPWCKAAGDLAADCRHAPEAHDGDHGRPLWRHDARRCHDGGVPAPGGLGKCPFGAAVAVPRLDQSSVASTCRPVRTALEFC